jgi:hypothetical protein
VALDLWSDWNRQAKGTASVGMRGRREAIDCSLLASHMTQLRTRAASSAVKRGMERSRLELAFVGKAHKLHLDASGGPEMPNRRKIIAELGPPLHAREGTSPSVALLADVGDRPMPRPSR